MLNTKCFGFATALACLAAASSARAASFIDIINPGDPAFTEALGINNSGTVVGYFGDVSSVPNNGFVLTPPSSFTNQNFPGASSTQVAGIAGNGNTVGSYVNAAGYSHGFNSVGGVFTTIDQPGTIFNQLLGISQNSTTAAGYSSATSMTGASGQQAYTFALGGPVFTTIALPSNINSQATGVNNSGMVVGFYQTTGGNFTAFTDVGGTITSFQALGSMSTQALGVNDLGQIVGDYIDSGGVTHGFLDSGGIFTTLDDPPGTATIANGINDLGQIVGFYTNANGATIGFETQISETPLPAALPLFATGLGALGLLGWRRKRKGAAALAAA